MNSNRTILHVEDRPEDVFLLKYAFQQAGITNPLQVVADGQEAIDYLAGVGKYADRQQFPLPYLVVLDLKLPIKMGLEVLAWIRGQPAFKSLLVIILTTSIYEGDVKRAYDLGATAFLVKPSDQKVTLDMCKAIKHFWIQHNHPPLDPSQFR